MPLVSGTDASVIQQVTLKVGEGLSGWVARARKPLVNASPHLDTPAATSLRSALVTPLLFRNRSSAHWRCITGRPISTTTHTVACRACGRPDCGGHCELAAVRSGAGDSLTDPAHGASEHPLALHASDP